MAQINPKKKFKLKQIRVYINLRYKTLLDHQQKCAFLIGGLWATVFPHHLPELGTAETT